MFIKFKKFAFMFVLCMGIFGTTAFAEVNHTAPDGYFYEYVLSYNSNGKIIIAYSNSNIYLSSDYYKCTGNWYRYVDGVLVYSGNTSVDVCYSKGSGITNLALSYSEKESVDTVPPTIAPTVQQAIQTITPQLSSQLKVLLPIGVVALSLMLGVLLVPRLARLFL